MWEVRLRCERFLECESRSIRLIHHVHCDSEVGLDFGIFWQFIGSFSNELDCLLVVALLVANPAQRVGNNGINRSKCPCLARQIVSLAELIEPLGVEKRQFRHYVGRIGGLGKQSLISIACLLKIPRVGTRCCKR